MNLAFAYNMGGPSWPSRSNQRLDGAFRQAEINRSLGLRVAG